MKIKLKYIEEPQLKFAYNQNMEDPRDGLTLFGPIESSNPKNIRAGVVGTIEGLKIFKKFLKKLQKPIYNENNNSRPFFPGFETVFRCKMDVENVAFSEINEKEINGLVYHADTHKRTYDLVNLYYNKLVDYVDNEDDKVDVWFVIIPEIIYKYCRPNSVLPKNEIKIRKSVSKKYARKAIREGAMSLFEKHDEDMQPYKHDAQFHHQLKAKLIKKGNITTQLLRESKLDWKKYTKVNGQPINDLSKIEGHYAWCVSTATFYKAGGRPWKLSNVREGVCYIGLIYKVDRRNGDNKNACCAAQMFLDDGDGVVFKGTVGPWYNVKTKEFHLDKKQAKELISIAIKSFYKKKGEYPKELFIHANTRFNEEEWSGFSEAVPGDTDLVGITIKSLESLKLYRDHGNYPMLRGLYYEINKKSGYLWTKGYVPRLQTSLASEVPNPLFIEISKGNCDIKTVMRDILALTKLNYNSCIYGDGIPVTLRFANAIGEILTASPLDESTPPMAFKYYI